jgi:hypothetical protein
MLPEELRLEALRLSVALGGGLTDAQRFEEYLAGRTSARTEDARPEAVNGASPGPAEPENLDEAIHRAIGAASTCWEKMEGCGVFDSDRAHRIALELAEQIRLRVHMPVMDPCLAWFVARRGYQ